MLVATAPSSHAALGGGRDSVEGDRAHLAARLESIQGTSHTVHVLTLANGAVVREYARPDGIVFALAWEGPARPDLRQLMGSRFSTLQADNIGPGGRRTRRPLSVHRADLLVSSGGHSGAFWGMAYLPKLAPAGFSPKDVS